MSKKRTIIIATVAAVIGIGLGASAAGETETVTKTVEADPIVKTETVTEEVEVEVASEACLDALDQAEVVIAGAADALSIASDGFHAAADFDLAALKDANDRMVAQADVVGAARTEYDTLAGQCRSAG